MNAGISVTLYFPDHNVAYKYGWCTIQHLNISHKISHTDHLHLHLYTVTIFKGFLTASIIVKYTLCLLPVNFKALYFAILIFRFWYLFLFSGFSLLPWLVYVLFQLSVSCSWFLLNILELLQTFLIKLSVGNYAGTVKELRNRYLLTSYR